MAEWQPAPGEKVWVEGIATARYLDGYMWPLFSRGPILLPHAVLDALKGMVERFCPTPGIGWQGMSAEGSKCLHDALIVLVQAGEVRCVVEGDRVTARFEWVKT